jgi:hypothetical protein
VQDNPGLDVAQYRATMANLSEALQAQLLEGDWGAFEGMALPGFGDVNLVESFPLGDAFDRLEAMDYGLNGVAWSLLASDFDGNQVFVDSIAGSDLLPDEVAELVLAKRKGEGWGLGNTVHADPSIWHRTGARRKFGDAAVLADEFADNGVPLVKANNDPRAGLIRLRTLVEPDESRRFPLWHPRSGEYGSPQLFVVGNRCPELVEQLRSAPLQPIDKADAGEKVDPVWEGRYGHFCAMARYAVMSRPSASEEPEEPFADEEEAAGWLRRESLLANEREADERFEGVGRWPAYTV